MSEQTRGPQLMNIVGLNRLTDTQRAEQRLRIAHEILLVMLLSAQHDCKGGDVFVHSEKYIDERVNEALRFADALIERVG